MLFTATAWHICILNRLLYIIYKLFTTTIGLICILDSLLYIIYKLFPTVICLPVSLIASSLPEAIQSSCLFLQFLLICSTLSHLKQWLHTNTPSVLQLFHLYILPCESPIIISLISAWSAINLFERVSASFNSFLLVSSRTVFTRSVFPLKCTATRSFPVALAFLLPQLSIPHQKHLSLVSA